MLAVTVTIIIMVIIMFIIMVITMAIILIISFIQVANFIKPILNVTFFFAYML